MKVTDLLSAGDELQHKVRKLYEGSFPVYERRTWDTQLRASQDTDSKSLLFLSDDGVFMALLFYWIHREIVYVEYIAVNPNLRGQNIGSKVMEHLLSESVGKTVILEIDPPQDEISIRRLHFYERLGFIANHYVYVHPSYATGAKAHPHELSIMSYKKTIPQKEFDKFITFMHDTVLKYVD